MSQVALLLELDAQRRGAMLAADAKALGRLLADDLAWTHSSGATESKTDFIASIVEQRVAYHELAVEQDQVSCLGTVFLHQGVLVGSASRDGQAKALCAKFLAVWRSTEKGTDNNGDNNSENKSENKSENGVAPMQLIAWQSTNYRLPTA